MFTMLTQLWITLQDRLRNEKGAVAFEYILLIGGASVLIIGGIAVAAPNLMGQVLEGTCNAVADLVGDRGFVSCDGIGGGDGD